MAGAAVPCGADFVPGRQGPKPPVTSTVATMADTTTTTAADTTVATMADTTVIGRAAAAMAVADTVTLAVTDTVRAESADSTRYGISVRTNLLWDAVAEPNLGVEVPLGKHWSVSVDGGLKPWPRWLAWDWSTENPVHWRNFTVVPELRYYFKEMYHGLYTGLDLLYTHFNVANIQFPFGMYPNVRANRMQGDLVAAGLLVGRSFWLGAHWRLEAQLGAAVGYYWAGKYGCTHCSGLEENLQGPAVVPKLGVNLGWNPIARQKKKEVLETINNQ